MKPKLVFNLFSLPRRKLLEIGFLAGILVVSSFWVDVTSLSFFATGYCWNWSISNEVEYVFKNKNYRFSFFRMISNLDKLVTLPFLKLHPFYKIIPKSLPSGFFILGLINFLQSNLSPLPVFLGSLVFELINLENTLSSLKETNLDKELPPDIPME